jgi:hypothetical protein
LEKIIGIEKHAGNVRKFMKAFCGHNCLDFLHVQSFSQCSILVFPFFWSKSSVSKRLQILDHLPPTCTILSQHSVPALKNLENK